MLNTGPLPEHTMLYHICAFTESIPTACKVLPVIHPTLLKTGLEENFPTQPDRTGIPSLGSTTLWTNLHQDSYIVLKLSPNWIVGSQKAEALTFYLCIFAS